MGSGLNYDFALKTDEETLAFLQFNAFGVSLRDNYLAILAVIVTQFEAGVSPNRLLGMDHKRLSASVAYMESITREIDTELHKACIKVIELTDP